MNQPTHAWLAVEAYKKIAATAETDGGKKKKLDGLAGLLGANLKDVVVAAWLPDSLIRDTVYGHIFKNSEYKGKDGTRFILDKETLRNNLVTGTVVPDVAFNMINASWWETPYKVKTNGGHLPARVTALCQTIRDMFKMGDSEVEELTGITSKEAKNIAQSLLYSPRNIAVTFWMASHYIADAHMPFHCDNRAFGTETHAAVEDLWGEQVPPLFHAKTILNTSREDILDARLPAGSKFAKLNLGNGIPALKNGGDPWLEAVQICKTSFVASFAMVPPGVAPVDDRKTPVGLDDILGPECCGEAKFWKLSQAVMHDAINAIAMFWQDAWVDFTKAKPKN